jgi:NTE family protein
MKTILVLGGGGVKGMAHAGAWRALQESGLEIAEIVGTSIGALVGACIAGGQSWRVIEGRALALTKPDIVLVNRWALLLNGIRQPSVFQGEPLADYIRAVLPAQSFEDLRVPLAVNAVDLETGAEVWFGAGGRSDVALADAVYASCALPVFYPPAQIGDRYYIDGGAVDPLAVVRAAERGADLVIAIDVGSGPEVAAAETVEKGIVAIHHRVFSIMSYARKRARLDAWTGPTLLYVRPRLDGYSTFDFESTDYFLEEGFRATQEALATLPGRLEAAGGAEELAG